MASTALLPIEPPAPPRSRAMRVVKLIAGAVLLLAGIAMLVLPGPGIATMVGALWVLGDDVAWARRMRLRLTALLADARARAGL